MGTLDPTSLYGNHQKCFQVVHSNKKNTKRVFILKCVTYAHLFMSPEVKKLKLKLVRVPISFFIGFGPDFTTAVDVCYMIMGPML